MARRDDSFARELTRMIRIEQPVADNSFAGAGSGEWAWVADVYAGVRDTLPSKGEQLADGISSTERPSRVRIRFRNDVTAAMRFRIGGPGKDQDGNDIWLTDRIVQIVSGPAEIKDRRGLEFMAIEYKPAGNAA